MCVQGYRVLYSNLRDLSNELQIFICEFLFYSTVNIFIVNSAVWLPCLEVQLLHYCPSSSPLPPVPHLHFPAGLFLPLSLSVVSPSWITFSLLSLLCTTGGPTRQGCLISLLLPSPSPSISIGPQILSALRNVGPRKSETTETDITKGEKCLGRLGELGLRAHAAVGDCSPHSSCLSVPGLSFLILLVLLLLLFLPQWAGLFWSTSS